MNDINNIIENIKTGENLFITGPAGSGKSFIIKEIINVYKDKNIHVTSSTGISAINISATTIHSFLSIGIKNNLQDVVTSHAFKRKIKFLEKVKILLIDEISMINDVLFDLINDILCYINRNDLPFGGIQMVCFGDFFQLPPVQGNYAFKSKSWIHLKPVIIKKIYRQNDEEFVNFLNKIRIGEISQKEIDIINKKVNESKNKTLKPDSLYLFSKNKEADTINSLKFEEISKNNKIYVYHMSTINTNNFSLMPNVLKLCKNCKVILLINLDIKKGLVNGSIGYVTGFFNTLPIVKFENGIETTISKFVWKSEDESKSITQIPLNLAYALSIHKSQGMTLEEAIIDLKDCFTPGQAYVALSRIKSLDGLHILNFNKNSIMVDNDVKKYYQSIINK